MPSPKELAKALARQDSVTQQPRNRFLGATSDAFKFLSDQADRYVVPERDPLLAGMRGGDLLPFGNVARLLDDLSHGGRITTGRGQTTALRPEVVDTVALGGMLKNPVKLAGIAALKNAAKQIHTGTGVLGSKVMNPRMNMFAGEGAKTADHGALKVAKDMKAAGVPDEAIHAKTGWTFGFADRKPRFEIDDSAAKGQFTHLPPSTDRLAEQAISHPRLYREYPELSQLNQLGLKEAKESGSFSPTFTNDEYSGGSILAKAPNETGIKSVGLHELQHAIQQREGFAKGGNPSDFKTKAIPRRLKGVAFGRDMREMAISQRLSKEGLPIADGKYHNLNDPKIMGKARALAESDPVLANYLDEYISQSAQLEKYPTAHQQYRRLAGEAEARLTQARMNMTPAERAASYPPSMFDVPVKDQIVRYGDNVGGAMMQRPKTEFEILHDTAQRNAALPKEQGGLGLPEGNTGMDRAAAMDWNTPAYHGTTTEIDPSFNLDYSGANALDYGKKNIWASDNPELASQYAEAGLSRNQAEAIQNSGDFNWNKKKEIPKKIADAMFKDIAEYGSIEGGGANVLPLLLRGKQSVHESYGGRFKNEMPKALWGRDLENADIAVINNVIDNPTLQKVDPSTVYAIKNPANIRSRFAAFDPMRRHEADILAGVGVGGMLDPQAIAEALRQQDRK